MSRFHFNIPLGQSDGCPCGFKRNDIFGAIGSIGSAVVSGIFSGSQQSSAMEFSDEQAQLAYERQRALNEQGYDIAKRLQDAQNAYNTPEAQVERYRKAGLNPFLMAHGNNIGSGTSQGSQPAPSGSAPMAQTPHANPVQVPDLGALLLQSSAIKNEAIKAKSDFIRSMPDLVKSVGSKKAKELASTIFGSGLNTSTIEREIDSYVSNLENQASLSKTQAYLAFTYGEKQAQQIYNRGEQEIANMMLEGTEILSRIGLNKSSAATYDAQVREIASKIIRNVAEAWNLRKQGEYYVANSTTVNQLRQYLVSSARSNANMLSTRSYLSGSEPDTSLFDFFHSGRFAYNRKEAIENQMERNADHIWSAVDRFFSDYVKIQGSGSSGGNTTTTEYYSAPTAVGGFHP